MRNPDSDVIAKKDLNIGTFNLGPRINAGVVITPSALNKLDKEGVATLTTLIKTPSMPLSSTPKIAGENVRIDTVVTDKEINSLIYLQDDLPLSPENKTPKFWAIPSCTNSYIVRDKLLCIEDRLESQLCGNKSTAIVITGYPGVGKTQGVYHYATSYHFSSSPKYSGGAYMFDGEDEAKMFESYKKFACRLGLITEAAIKDINLNPDNKNKVIKLVNTCLQTRERMLLFIDNAPNSDSIKDYFLVLENRQLPPHHIVITSCNREWIDYITIQLSHYSSDEAYAYLEKVWKNHSLKLPTHRDTINQFIDMLSYYPLGLAQAAHTIIADNNEIWTIDAYINEYRTASKLFSAGKIINAPALGDSEKTIRITWHLALERMRKCYPGYSDHIHELFGIISYFKADKIPLTFFYKYYKILFNWDEEHAKPLLILCHKFSLFEYSNINSKLDGILVHQVFHTVLQCEYEQTSALFSKLIKFIVEHLAYNQFSGESINEWILYYDHFDYIIKNLSSSDNQSQEFVKLILDMMGYYLFEHTNAPMVEQLQLQSQKFLLTVLKQLPSIYQGRYYLYWLMCACGNKKLDKEEVMAKIQTAIDIFEKENTQENKLYLMALYTITSAYYCLVGESDKALYESEKAIALLSRERHALNLQDNYGHFRIFLRGYVSSGKLLLSNDNFPRAKILFTELLKLLEESKFTQRYVKYYHMVLMFLGQIEVNVGNYNEALIYYTRAHHLLVDKLKTTEMLWREIYYLACMGEFHFLHSNYGLAHDFYLQGEKRLRQIYADRPAHDMALNLLDVAEAYLMQKNIGGANASLLKSQQICRDIYGVDCRNFIHARILLFQGWQHSLLNDTDAAYQLCMNSKKIFEEVKSTDHRYYGELLLLLGTMLHHQNKDEEAKKYLTQAIKLFPPKSNLIQYAEMELGQLKARSITLSNLAVVSLVFMLLIYLFNKIYGARVFEDRKLSIK